MEILLYGQIRIRRKIMGLSVKDQKILWGRAAGCCSFQYCADELVADKTEFDPAVVIGENAHIIGKSKKGPRGKALPIDKRLRDSYENAILLCTKHHKIVDKQRNTYTVDVLKQMKEAHERLVKENPNFTKNKIYSIKWVVFLQQAQKIIDKKLALEALRPDAPYRKPIILSVQPEKIGWESAKQIQESTWSNIISKLPLEYTRFAIFSLTHIPLAIHLGYLINDRYRVRIYEYQRDLSSWQWSLSNEPQRNNKLFVKGLPKATIQKSNPVIIRVSISAEVAEHLTTVAVPKAVANTHIYVKKPAVNIVKHPGQIDELGIKFREILNCIRKMMPNCAGIHLFYAGPCSGAVNIGRQINPTMNPPIYLYQYNAQDRPKHKHVLTLNKR